MKKTVTTCMLCGCLAIGSAFAQTTPRKDVNRISFGAKWGYNYLLLSDRTQFACEVNPSFGAFFEITANPFWSAGVEYLYMNNCQTPQGGGHLEAAMHGITYYNSINIANLVAQHRSAGWQKFNVFGTLGGGVGLYNYEFKDTHTSKESGAQPFMMSALAMEYNITKTIALGVESHFRYTPDTKFVPTANPANLCGLQLTGRIKLGGDKNVRNISVEDFYIKPQVAPVVDNSAALNQQKQQIDALENTVANQNDDLQALQSQVNDLKNELAQQKVAAQKKPVQAAPAPVVLKPNTTSFPAIDFTTNSAILTTSSYPELDNIASQMKAHPTWKIEIAGHTDNTGTEANNNILSKERADAIKTYLENKGVADSAITTVGFGSLRPIASNDTPEGRAKNRRVEMKVTE